MGFTQQSTFTGFSLTGSSRTPGDHPGASRGTTSSSEGRVCAASTWLPALLLWRRIQPQHQQPPLQQLQRPQPQQQPLKQPPKLQQPRQQLLRLLLRLPLPQLQQLQKLILIQFSHIKPNILYII